jgi:GWxTD domain-containing protein
MAMTWKSGSGNMSAAVTLLGVLLAAAPVTAGLKQYEGVDITNFLLGPGHAQWLVGPIAHIASEKERRDYLALTDDAAAAQFVATFWERRGPNLVFPPTGPKITFDERAEEADRIYSEGTYLGRRTDRGTVFILYGAPDSIEFGSSPTRFGAPVEVWNYSTREKGLDGKKPDRRYAFRKQESLTEFFPLSGVQLPRKTRSPIRGPGVPPPDIPPATLP